MADKIIKINSLQGGPFTSSNNRWDYRIPSGATYDLSKSYIQLNTNVTYDGVGAYPVHNPKIQYLQNDLATESNLTPDNIALVKNCHLTSRKYGQLENIRRVDQLKMALHAYTKSREERQGDLFKGLNQDPGRMNVKLSPLVEYVGEGNGSSKAVEFPIRVPLSDMFNLGAVRTFDTNALGECRIHVEANLERFKAVQDTTLEAEYALFGDVDLEGDVTQVETLQRFDRLEDSPYYTGMSLDFSATGNGGASDLTDVTAIVQSIAYVRTDNTNAGRIVLTLDRSIGTLTSGQSYININCEITPMTGVMNLQFNYAELVLQETDPAQTDGLSYTTFSTEEDDGLEQTNFSKMYTLESNAVNLLTVFPDDNTGLLSVNDNVSDYRLRLDNEDLENRNVDFHQPLYYDKIVSTLLNMNKPTHRLVEKNHYNDFSDQREGTAGQDLTTIMTHCPLTPNPKLLQVNINGTGTGVKKITLFKEVVRQISF